MEKLIKKIGNFSAAIVENKVLVNSGANITTIQGIKDSGFKIISASVPGNTELDMMAAGLIDFDPFFGTDTFKMQNYENIHTIYFTTFDDPGCECKLYFEGIDTIADIYVNGQLMKSTDNMYISYDVSLPPLKKADNELVVHIKPAVLEARKYDLPVVSKTLEYNYSSLYVRKAAHMYGWDIMPRIVSSGIWKPVYLKEVKHDKIKEAYVYTRNIDTDAKTANIALFCNFSLTEDKAQDYTLKIHGECGDSVFEKERTIYSNTARIELSVSDCKFWWPRNYGEANLYSTDITLLYKGAPVDTVHIDVGIRLCELLRTETTDENGSGEFCFIINGKRIFAMGSNWVPLDAFHSRDIDRLQKAFDLLYDTGANIIRCWGGNVYESDEFYSLCDKNGIMVWQDFAMGCAVYPREEKFYKMLGEEAEFIIKRLRNHPSIILWAGDNECDMTYRRWGMSKNPNPDRNIITREFLAELCELHDFVRPYLPSSPFITGKATIRGNHTPEEHTWGPRDYFKGEYYKNTVCHFVSEVGYHACPSPASVAKFIPQTEMWPWYKGDGNPHASWLAHCTSMTDSMESEFAYRIKLMADQVDVLFEKKPDNLADFAKMSQISQAEADKYFIEKYRISKPRRTGIIWWNIIDGWPQFSDAVVDYYYTKKLAYHYIKRSQEPICLMFDEPQNNILPLYVSNDTSNGKAVSYNVTNVTDGKVVVSGGGFAFAEASTKLCEICIEPNEKKFYLIEWTVGDDETVYKNHYFTNIIDIDYEHYTHCLEKCGFDQFEGF